MASSWTYNPSLSRNLDKVRFLCGDTDSAAAVTISDEEIAGALLMAGGPKSAAALCCDFLAAKYAAQGQSVTDDLGQSVSYANRAQEYATRARQLRAMASFAATPFAGGQSISGKTNVELDDDRVQPAFRVDVQEAPSTRQHITGAVDLIEKP